MVSGIDDPPDERCAPVLKLMRELRCSLSDASATVPLNSWAGELGEGDMFASLVLRAIVEGPVDPKTGFLCNIKSIDAILRNGVLGPLAKRFSGGPRLLQAVAGELPSLFIAAAKLSPERAALLSLQIEINPHTRFEVVHGESSMVKVTRAFEFSASHRLYAEGLSDQENLRVFGKCSNPHGHGHNYVVEVTLSGSPHDPRGVVVNPPEFDRIVKEHVIDPFDHRNLNVECADFSKLNPSVENIALVIWRRLVDTFQGCRLDNVRVWETPKTYAEYSGEPQGT